VSTVFNQHTTTSIFVGQTGHTHNRAEDAAADAVEAPTAIDCSACEPFLVKEGWVYNPAGVPLTERQVREQEQTEREGNLAVKHVAEALADRAAEVLVAGRTPSAPRAPRTPRAPRAPRAKAKA
jgi:hypothetical protein